MDLEDKIFAFIAITGCILFIIILFFLIKDIEKSSNIKEQCKNTYIKTGELTRECEFVIFEQ